MSNFILKIILIPLAVLGGFNVFRGFGAVIEMDEARFGSKFKKRWQTTTYLVITLLSYFALFYILSKEL